MPVELHVAVTELVVMVAAVESCWNHCHWNLELQVAVMAAVVVLPDQCPSKSGAAPPHRGSAASICLNDISSNSGFFKAQYS